MRELQQTKTRPRFGHLVVFGPIRSMNVLALTILISSCLAGIFIACFAAEIRRGRRTSPERDSLLPLDLEIPPTAKAPVNPLL